MQSVIAISLNNVIFYISAINPHQFDATFPPNITSGFRVTTKSGKDGNVFCCLRLKLKQLCYKIQLPKKKNSFQQIRLFLLIRQNSNAFFKKL